MSKIIERIFEKILKLLGNDSKLLKISEAIESGQVIREVSKGVNVHLRVLFPALPS